MNKFIFDSSWDRDTPLIDSNKTGQYIYTYIDNVKNK